MMFLSPDSPVSDARTLVIGYFCRNIPSCISFKKLFFRCFCSALVNRLFYINLRNHYKTGRDCGSSPWSLPVFYCARKSLTLMILGSVTDDSRKSLSPVRNKSAPTPSAARRIGLSFISRIFSSASASSPGMGMTSMDCRAANRNASSSTILSGNFSRNLRCNSSTT